MNDMASYVAQLLDRYHRLPGTTGHILRDDRRTALALHHRQVGLDIVEKAFVLALARRTFGSSPQHHVPIRTLRYFLPVIDEIVHAPPDPAYLQHLECRLRHAGLYPPD